MKEVLLVIFAFTLNPEGNPDNLQVFKVPFATLEDCNYYGRNLRTYAEFPDEVKTLSYCVSPQDYVSP